MPYSNFITELTLADSNVEQSPNALGPICVTFGQFAYFSELHPEKAYIPISVAFGKSIDDNPEPIKVIDDITLTLSVAIDFKFMQL